MNSLLKLIKNEKNILDTETALIFANRMAKCEKEFLNKLDSLFTKEIDEKVLLNFFESVEMNSLFNENDYKIIMENLKDFSICSINIEKERLYIEPFFSNKEYTINLFVNIIEEKLTLSNFDLVMPDYNEKYNLKFFFNKNKKIISALNDFIKRLNSLSNIIELYHKKDLDIKEIEDRLDNLSKTKTNLNDLIDNRLFSFNKDGDIHYRLLRLREGLDYDELRDKVKKLILTNSIRKDVLFEVIWEGISVMKKDCTALKRDLEELNSLFRK